MTIKETAKKFIPKFLLRAYHFCWTLAGAVVCGFPGKNKNLKIIGITGTSGKSTTIDFVCRILEEVGFKVASFSSVRFKVGNKEWKNELKMTMPGRMKVQKFLRQAVNEKCQFAVLEITSEGIRQSRHRFINFDTAVFTNLSKEHIESHGGFENYRNEKLKLFKTAKNIHIVNADNENAKYFLDIPAENKITFSIKDAKNIQTTDNGILFQIQNTEFGIPLLGKFNIYNSLAAICVAKAYDIDLEICRKALEKVKGIPGRMEIISESPVKIIVDYAHTPEQLESVYKALSNCSVNYKSQAPNSKQIPNKFQIQNSRLICVLGSCGGGRDKWKRPVLGELAKKYCKEIIITNEDPYDENPFLIMDEIEKGFSSNPKSQIPNPKYEKILDRKEAIEKAIKLAKPRDVVIITGKGSEPWMCIENGKKIPWDDRQIARDALKSM